MVDAGFSLPPLVTTASPTDPERTRGALGFGTTQLLFGNGLTSQGPSSAHRFTLGYNLDPCGLCAIEGTFFFLGARTIAIRSTTTCSPGRSST